MVEGVGTTIPGSVTDVEMYMRFSESSQRFIYFLHQSGGGFWRELLHIGHGSRINTSIVSSMFWSWICGFTVMIWRSIFPGSFVSLLLFEPYWYYNEEVGYGPETVVINVTRDEDDALTELPRVQWMEWATVDCAAGQLY